MPSLGNIIRAIKSDRLIITPVITPWLLKHGDEALPDWVIERLVEVMRTKPRDRSGSFSGSAAGQCMRRQELEYAGVRGGTVDPQLQNIFNDGKYRHLRWQGYLLTTGLATDIEYLVKWPAMKSRGALDARGVVPDDHPRKEWRGLEYGVEIKGVSTFQFSRYKSEGRKPEHIDQVDHYFALGAFDMFITIYEDKTTQDWFEWVDFPNPERLKVAEWRITELAKAAKTKTLHPMLEDCKTHKGDYPDCPYGTNGACERALSHIPKPFER